MKAWFGLLQDVKVVDLNRLLKSHGVRLVVKKSKDWGKNVSVTAHPIGAAAKRTRAPKAPVPAAGLGAASGLAGAPASTDTKQ